MLRFMDRENAEENGWDFYDRTVQVVRAAVRFLKAAEKRPKPWPLPVTGQGSRGDQLRDASAKRMFGRSRGEVTPTSYTAQDLAHFLKRTECRGDRECAGECVSKEGKECTTRKAQTEIVTALDALELMAEKDADGKPLLQLRGLRGFSAEAVGKVVNEKKALHAAAQAAAEKAEREAREKAEKERQRKEEAEQRQREYDEARKKRESEEKVKREREAAEAAKRRAAEAEADRKRADAIARSKRADEEKLRAERAAAAGKMIVKLRSRDEGGEGAKTSHVDDDRRIEKKIATAPQLKPTHAVDLTPRGERVAGQLVNLTIPVDLAPLLMLAYDPAHSFTKNTAAKIRGQLLRLAREISEQQKALAACARKRNWTFERG